MAVKSTVGQSIAGALGSITSFGEDQDKRVLSRQSIQANQNVLDKNAAQQNIQTVYASMQANPEWEVRNDTTGKVTYDIEKIVDQKGGNQDLTKTLLNQLPALTNGIDEKGNPIALQGNSVIKNVGADGNWDGSYSVTVTRPDGKEVPITEGRTAQGDDVVQRITAEDLQRLGNRAITNLQVKSGQDFGLVNDLDAVYGVAIQQELADRKADPQTQAGFLRVLNDPKTTPEQLEELAAEMGIDTEPLRAQYQAKADEEKAAADAAADAAAAARPKIAGGVRPEFKPSTAPTAKERAIEDNRNKRNPQRFEDIDAVTSVFKGGSGKTAINNWLSDTIFDTGDKESDVLRQSIYDSLADVREGLDPNTIMTREQSDAARAADTWFSENGEILGERLINDSAAKKNSGSSEQTLAQELKEIGGVAFYEKYNGAELAIKDAATLADEAAKRSAGATIDPFSKDDLTTVIREGLTEPTEEQYANMRTYLESKGVVAPRDLQKLPAKIQSYAAMLIASRAGDPGDTSAKLKVFQETMNLVERGATDYSKNQQESNKSNLLAAQASIIKTREATMARLSAQSDAASGKVGSTVDNFYAVIGDDSTEEVDYGNAWRSAYTQSRGGGNIAIQMQKELPTMFAHLIKRAAADTNNATWGQWALSFPRDAMGLTIGQLEDSLAVEKDASGKIISVGFRLADGGYAEETISGEDLANLMGGTNVMNAFLKNVTDVGL